MIDWQRMAGGPARPVVSKMTTKRPPRYIHRMSPKRRARIVEYHKKRRSFLLANPWCAWGLAQNPKKHIRSTEVHHTRGRIGALLLDERFWKAVSSEGHNWIHAHPNEARKLGLLCEVGQWNRVQPFTASGSDSRSGAMEYRIGSSPSAAPESQPGRPLLDNGSGNKISTERRTT